MGLIFKMQQHYKDILCLKEKMGHKVKKNMTLKYFFSLLLSFVGLTSLAENFLSSLYYFTKFKP